MEDRKLLIVTAALLSILRDGPAPSGVVYSALCGRLSLSEYRQVCDGLEAAGLLSGTSGHVLRLTARGHEVAAQIDEAAGVGSDA